MPWPAARTAARRSGRIDELQPPQRHHAVFHNHVHSSPQSISAFIHRAAARLPPSPCTVESASTVAALPPPLASPHRRQLASPSQLWPPRLPLTAPTCSRRWCSRARLSMIKQPHPLNNIRKRAERSNGVETLEDQKWSGANFDDKVLKTVQGGISSTLAMGKGVTVEQFKGSWTRPGSETSSERVLAKSRM